MTDRSPGSFASQAPLVRKGKSLLVEDTPALTPRGVCLCQNEATAEPKGMMPLEVSTPCYKGLP